jgi:hypothetical protein
MGLALTLIHLISIPVTNASVNPALLVGGWALHQLWLFWLAPIAGAAAAGGIYRALLRPLPSDENKERPARGPWRWVAPSLLTLVFFGIVFFAVRPLPSPSPQGATADASRLRSDFDQALGSLSRTLNGITNEASAKAALPRLSEQRAKVDSLRAEADRLPAEERARWAKRPSPRLGELRSAYRRVTSIPGASEPVKSVLADLMVHLSAPVGSAPAERPPEAR